MFKGSSLLVIGGRQAGVLYASSVTPKMPPFDYKPVSHAGVPYDETMSVRRTNMSPNLLTYYKKPLMMCDGKRQWLFDSDGKRYLDMFAGIVTVGVGHCHPHVNKAAIDQINKLWHTTCIYLTEPMHKFASQLADKMPGNLKVFYFTNSGSEANDLAMMLARLHTKNYDLISLRNSYHGTSPATVGLLAMSTWKHSIPQGFGVHHTMNPDVYRGLWGGSNCRDSPIQTTRVCDCQSGQCKASEQYVGQLEEVLKYSVPKAGVAGIFCESIQGVGGIVQFPKSFVKKAFELVRSKGGVCISDEVQTGFGRTGEHFWGFEGHGVTPDIVTMAKSIGNGFPLAAVATTPEIAASFSNALHLNTFGGNPIGCAVGTAVLEVIEKEKTQENCLKIGTYLLQKLQGLRDKFEVVGDVRGKGLMIGVDLVTDKESRAPIEAKDFAEIWEDVREMGVLIGKGGMFGNVFRIQPPMCIDKSDADFCVDVLDVALTKYSGKKRSSS